ncbi:M48 family metallopeptidase [Tahibacter amnicola]|uniref:M48 family metallopeptidase n=1 Tax=Tahibacter amnicola TaxID=2976241 RepID=A0ABY6BEY9_9GAMM|nr:SprT family zinc-dependent metalloprotease [Tahibacter amnicola]UXI68603.1 M48 family metallopeptidase [Tahibacter amnicola]
MAPDDNRYLELATPKGETIKVLKRVHPRARRLRLTVTSSGARLSYPEGTHPAQVFAFLRKHVNWLERKLDELQLDSAGPPPVKPGAPTLIPLRGETIRLMWRDGAFPAIAHEDDKLILTVPSSTAPRALSMARALLRSFLETQIRRDISRLMARYTGELGAAPVGVRVRPLKSLWGSLDTRDRMTLDLALALAPPAALKYVVIHELCHLKIRNHSPRYWALVSQYYPEWKEQRTWLREKGHALKAELSRLIGR